MATTKQISTNSGSKLDEHLTQFNRVRFRQMNFVVRKPRRRRIHQKSVAENSVQHRVDSYIALTEKLIKVSEEILRLVHLYPYSKLMKYEKMSDEIDRINSKRIEEFESLHSKYSYKGHIKLQTANKKLSEVWIQINNIIDKVMREHSLEGAIDRGYFYISNLIDKNLTLNTNLKLTVSKEEGEYHIYDEVYDISIYDEDFDEAIEGVKYCIQDLYYGLNEEGVKLSSYMTYMRNSLNLLIENEN